MIKPMVPPLIWGIGRDVKRRLVRSVDHYAYAPRGWNTPLPASRGDEASWRAFLARERAGYQELMACLSGDRPVLPVADETMKYVVFGYALALASRDRDTVAVIDYGGNLGEYLWIAKTLVPGIEVEFHCKELPAVAAVGRQLNPDVTWHTDEACLAGSYDLVMFSASLQFLPDWKAVLERAAHATRDALLVSDLPSVRHVPTFVMTERTRGLTNLQCVLNQCELVDAVQRVGLRLVSEFAMGPHAPVANAPEQPVSAGWLFRR